MSFDGISILQGTFAAPIGPSPRSPLKTNFETFDPDPAASRAAFTQSSRQDEAQKVRDSFLQARSLTESQVQTLPFGERNTLDSQFLDAFRQQTKAAAAASDQAGVFLDITA